MSENTKTLAGKVALVTGASKGIGAAIAKELAARGAAVVVNYASSKQGADEVVAAIRSAGGDAVAAAGSVADPAQIARLFAVAKERYGKLDILVNNAGVYTFAPLAAITVESISSMFDVNVRGVLLATQAGVALFPPEGGSVINIGSIVGEGTPPTSAVYAGTKGALNSITRVLAKELGPRRIRVNAINPGVTATEGYATAGFPDSEFERMVLAQTPLARLGQPGDIAAVAAFLASDDARWVTGSLLDAAGGSR